jgi:transcriptional regulator with XRE-family HTH domain
MKQLRIGTPLRRLRDLKQISTREIAERIGISQSTYVDWENEKSSPSIKNYLALAEAFEIDPIELMEYLLGNDHAVCHTKKHDLKLVRERLEVLDNQVACIHKDYNEMKETIKSIMERLEPATVSGYSH